MSTTRLKAFLPAAPLLFAALIARGQASPSPAPSPAAPKLYPIGMLSPQEEQKTFQLPPGYHMELVMSEPLIQEPVLCTFDGNGRMYVSEMRTYMKDANATGEYKPESFVSRHESTRGDGVFDRHTIYADHLLLPREVLPLDDRVLIGESETTSLKIYRDTKGDGVADQSSVFFKGEAPADMNMEHQESGPMWDIDNWLYSSVNNFRLRMTPSGGTIREETPYNRGQWGITQDNYGQQWWSNAGSEKGLFGFQVPIEYGEVDAPGEFSPDFMTVWPLIPIPDVQGGTLRFRPVEKTLNHFTGCCGQEFVTGDRLPELRGDVLIGEPVGRLIRLAHVTVKDGVTYIDNPYEKDKSEFIRSTDANFRPVDITTGPDGCIYIVDMYRGIIQEGDWTRPGSYLRGVIDKYGFAKNVNGGRIWRLVYDGVKPGPQPHMLNETTAQLVRHLDHPNGWWRMTAQKLIVLRQDKSVVPALAAMARTDTNPVARVHAIWTLEGLGVLNDEFIREKLRDPDPQVRIAAIRAGETLWKAGDQALLPDIARMEQDPDASVSLQSFLTAKQLNFPGWDQDFALKANDPAPVFRLIAGPLLAAEASHASENEFSAADLTLIKKGGTIFQQLCFACHGTDGKGTPMGGGAPGATLAPPLAGSRTVNGPSAGMLSVLLHGLSGPVNGKDYPGQMVSMAANNDEWIASVASYVRNNFGNEASIVHPEEVAALRKATLARVQPWTQAEMARALPQPLEDKKTWKVSASDNPSAAPLALANNRATRYSTGDSQHPGEWYQVELPQEETVSGVMLNAGDDHRDFPAAYKVQISQDGIAWSKPIAQGKGSGPATEILFPPVRARFIRIVQMGSKPGLYWSMIDLEVLSPDPVGAFARLPQDTVRKPST